ncbi:hypothetical protein HanRHA438_Chr15g0726011 [Helianthus annuus]|nr:hypothetical protein HanRHA438_Chr15g0726011 [Helianthus annuus]
MERGRHEETFCCTHVVLALRENTQTLSPPKSYFRVLGYRGFTPIALHAI